jgi:N-acetylneuraminic acid mutarotase
VIGSRARGKGTGRLAAALLTALLGAGAVFGIASTGGNGGGPDAAAASANRWRPLERGPIAVQEVAAARVGRHIYVVGGFLEGGVTTDQVSRYDIKRDRWRVLPPLPVAVNHPAAASAGGRLYVHGGFGGGGPDIATPRLFRYDPGSGWAELASSNVPRGAHALGAIDGKLYAAGGANGSTDQLTSLEIYDVASDTWTEGAPMSVGRNHVATAVVDGRLYVLGGRPPFNLAVVERYDPGTDTWTTRAPMDVPRSGFAAAVVGGRIVAFGGEDASQTVEPVEIYDPATDAWRDLPGMRTPRHGLGGASKGGRVFALLGGPEPGFSVSRVVEFLDVR